MGDCEDLSLWKMLLDLFEERKITIKNITINQCAQNYFLK